MKDESRNESKEGIQGERDSQTTLSFGFAFFFSMSEAKTDSLFFHPHPCSDFTFARMCEAIKYAGNYRRALCAFEKQEESPKKHQLV